MFRVEPAVVVNDAIRVRAAIASDYYVYRHRHRHRLKLEADGATIPLALPRGEAKTDEFFGATEIYRDALEFDARGTRATTATV